MREKQLKKLLRSMSLEEKIGQLYQLGGQFFKDESVITGPIKDLNITIEKVQNVGSTLNLGGYDLFLDAQKKHLKTSKIPLLSMADVINGYKTIFPIPLALACSFDEDLFYDVARFSAIECSQDGIGVTFSPMLDIVRDPRWGRVMESFGEDTYLGCVYAKKTVEGYQRDLNEEGTVATCIKHFACYGAVEAGREYNQVSISNRIKNDFYLPVYKAAIDAGAKLVMPSFNSIDLVPSTISKDLLVDLLRKKWGFKGVVISDYTAIEELICHGVCESKEEACALSMKSSVDVDMMSNVYANNLKIALEKKLISKKDIDKAVMRVLKLKNDLSLFENPYRFLRKDGNYEKEIEACAYKASCKSIVLLKNEKVLPLKETEKILFIGPFLDNNDFCGSWSFFKEESKIKTIKETFKNDCNFIMIDTPNIFDQELSKEETNSIISQAKEVDKVVMFIGEPSNQSGEARSKTDITIHKNIISLFNKIKKVNKHIISVLINGRPLVLNEINDSLGIVEAWYSGTYASKAIRDVLLGNINPSAKLSMSFPRSVGQIPIYYNSYATGRFYNKETDKDGFKSRYIDCENTPLYGFGHGLSYSDFRYSNLKLSKESFTKKEYIEVKVDITNNSNIDGVETTFMFIKDIVGSVTRPMMELKGFKKVPLAAHETKTISFIINEEMLRFTTINNEFTSEKGEFRVMVGTSCSEYLEKSFYLI